jgi:hypothetical protein
MLGVGPAAAQQSGSDEAQLRKLRGEILQMVGDAPCANVVHCRLLALGSRPCGGADEYLAYSSRTTDTTMLENKALEYSLIQEDLQAVKEVAGVCTVLPEPQLACIGGHCRVEGEH